MGLMKKIEIGNGSQQVLNLRFISLVFIADAGFRLGISGLSELFEGI